jgi:hypothetical protein
MRSPDNYLLLMKVHIFLDLQPTINHKMIPEICYILVVEASSIYSPQHSRACNKKVSGEIKSPDNNYTAIHNLP